MLSGVALSVLSTVKNLLTFVRSSLPSCSETDELEEGFHKLGRIVDRINATLNDADDIEVQDQSFELWLKELRGVVFDAEDILDEFRYDLLRCQVEAKNTAIAIDKGKQLEDGEFDQVINDSLAPYTSSSYFSENFAIRDQMISRIEKIQISLDEISKDREALRISKEDEERRRSMVRVNPLPTSHLFDESSIFGRHNDKSSIINLLLDGFGCEGDENIIITPIIGMGGLGKTTLARMVYNDPLIQKKFDRIGWVYVSLDFDVVKITKEIIESITGEPYGNFVGLSAAHKELKKLLENHNLFLVLDDVWDIKRSHWETLLGPLRHAKRARIIITTRNEAITRVLGITAPPRLEYLPEEDCWLLFQHCAFGSQESDQASSLVQIGRKIVKNCGGLPLAVKSIGVMLNFETDEDRWRAVLESEFWKLSDDDEIFPALKLSYRLLPKRLKPCFLYCSLFPKGCRLFKDHVIYMWMAHGYVQADGNKKPEDVGVDYFNDLRMRSFFEVLDGGWFKIHDMIHDLARSITTGEFCSIVDGKVYDIDEKIRHLYVENMNKLSGIKKHRSLRTFCSSSFGPISNSFNAYQNVSNLRALQLKDADECELELVFSTLKHLRYLGIGGDNVENLPKSVGVLYNLETLIIEHCYSLRGLPVTIRNLINLRCLCLTNCKIEEIPDYICQICNLHTLHVEACYNIVELPVSLESLINLHVLRLVSCSKIKGLPNSIGKLINLRILDLRFTPIKRLPESIGSLGNLQLLDLEGCWEMEDPHNGFRGFTKQKTISIHVSIPIAFVSRDPTMQAREIKWHHPTLIWLASLGGKLSIGGDNAKITFRQANKYQSFDLKSVVGLMSSDRSSDQLAVLFERKLYTQKYMHGMYTSSKEFLHTLQTYTKLIKLTIDGSYGIGYPEWSNPSFYKVTTVLLLMPYIEDGSFLRLVGHLPSLKVLILTGFFKTRRLGQHSFQCSNDRNVIKILFPSLESLELQDMPELECWDGLLDHNFPKLRSVIVQDCPKLKRIPKFNMLQELEIRRCGFSELLVPQDDMSSKLQKLFIEECIGLTSVQGLHNLNALRSLQMIQCPNLHISPQEGSLGLDISLMVMDCPNLKEWCDRQENYVKVHTSKHLRVGDMKHEFLNFSCVEHLCIENCAELSEEMLRNTMQWLPPTLISLKILFCSFSGCLDMHSGLSKLRTLEIRGCLNLESLEGLHRLRLLSNLILCDCPVLQISPILGEKVQQRPFLELTLEEGDERLFGPQISEFQFQLTPQLFSKEKTTTTVRFNNELPPLLESLVVEGCHSMVSLNLAHCEPSEFIELQVINCQRLMHIDGLRNLTCLETMTIIQCPHLQLELLVRVPNCVVVSGCPKLKGWCKMHCIEPLGNRDAQ